MVESLLVSAKVAFGVSDFTDVDLFEVSFQVAALGVVAAQIFDCCVFVFVGVKISVFGAGWCCAPFDEFPVVFVLDYSARYSRVFQCLRC